MCRTWGSNGGRRLGETRGLAKVLSKALLRATSLPNSPVLIQVKWLFCHNMLAESQDCSSFLFRLFKKLLNYI